MDEYVKLEKIGEGTYGVVYKARNKKTGKIVALKRVRLDPDSEGLPSTTLREIGILNELKHPNIIAMLDVIYSDDNSCLFISFEFMKEDLKKYMERCKLKRLPVPLVKSYMKQLLSALDYCHSEFVVHRDLKPQNLLVDELGHIKLADFGLARNTSLPYRCFTHEVVTLWYRPPEILLGSKFYHWAVDIWSIGCIMGELLCLQPLFSGDSEIDQLFRIFKTLGTPNDIIWPGVSEFREYKPLFPHWEPQPLSALIPDLPKDAEDLLQHLITYNPENRWPAKLALDHEFLTNVKLIPPPQGS